MKIIKNPPSPGFNKIGHGCSATVFSNDLGEIESIIKGRYYNRSASSIDGCKEVLVIAREILAEDSEALIFLPEITRDRISSVKKLSAAGLPYKEYEVVYRMPAYIPYYDGWETLSKEQNRAEGVLTSIKNRNVTGFDEIIQSIPESNTKNIIIRVFKAIKKAAKKLGIPYSEIEQDFKRDNIMVDPINHNLIFTDPISCDLSITKLLSVWKSHGLTPKKHEAVKNPVKIYHPTQRQIKNARKLNVIIMSSDNPKKKLDVYSHGIKVASIGASGYMDYDLYLKTTDKETADKRRKLYKIRHENDRHVIGTPGFYADRILW